jgi:hypothetical protein
MTGLVEKLIGAVKKAFGMSHGHSQAARGGQSPPNSSCVLCNIRMPLLKVDGVLHHEARHGGKRVLLRCTRGTKVQTTDRASGWPAGW